MKRPVLSVKQYLMRAAYPLVQAVVSRVPACKRLARSMYDLMTPDAERWMNVHGVPLLANIHR